MYATYKHSTNERVVNRLKNAACKLGDWYVVDQTILKYLIQANRFGLVLFSLVYISQVVYII